MFLFSFLSAVVSVEILFPDEIVERSALYPIRVAKGLRSKSPIGETHFQARKERTLEFYIQQILAIYFRIM
jgi:hypothetical protein